MEDSSHKKRPNSWLKRCLRFGRVKKQWKILVVHHDLSETMNPPHDVNLDAITTTLKVTPSKTANHVYLVWSYKESL